MPLESSGGGGEIEGIPYLSIFLPTSFDSETGAVTGGVWIPMSPFPLPSSPRNVK